MSCGEQFAKVIAAAVPVIWAALAFYVIWLLRKSLAGAVSRLSGFEGWGLKFSLTGGQEGMAGAFELARKHPKWNDDSTEQDRQAALDRAGKNRNLLEGAEILWVDDRPSNNRNEARMLRSFGCLLTFAASTEEALDALATGLAQARPFHLILSDISRAWPVQDDRAGLTMLDAFRAAHVVQPVVFYVGSPKPGAGTPDGAFGITHRPDMLLNLVVEALGRVRR